MIRTMVGLITGIIATLGGLHFISQKLLKIKIRKMLRKIIKELTKIEQEMDNDSPKETLEKISRLTSKLGNNF